MNYTNGFNLNGLKAYIPDRHTRNSLKQSIEYARSSVEEITNTINKLYDRPDTVRYKKTNVLKKERNLIESLDKAEKKKYIVKKKLYTVLSPFDNEEKLVEDLMKLNTLKSLPELVNMNTTNKKKDLFRLFKLRKLASQEVLEKDDITINSNNGSGSPNKSGFRFNDKTPISSTRRLISPIKGSKIEKTSHFTPIKLLSTLSPVKSCRSSSIITPLVSKIKTVRSKHISSIF
jgi:hypothetical protein